MSLLSDWWDLSSVGERQVPTRPPLLTLAFRSALLSLPSVTVAVVYLFPQVTADGKPHTLYIVVGIDPDTTVCAPKTKGEIGAYGWHYIKDLPATIDEANQVGGNAGAGWTAAIAVSISWQSKPVHDMCWGFCGMNCA